MIAQLANAVQKKQCGPFDLMNACAQLIGSDPFIDELTANWSDFNKAYVPIDNHSIDGGPVRPSISRAKVPLEYAELYWLKGGKWPGYDQSDHDAGVNIHVEPWYVYHAALIDRRFEDPLPSSPKSGPIRPAQYAAETGRLRQLHYTHDPFRKGSSQPLTRALSIMIRQGMEHPRAVLSSLTRLDGHPFSLALTYE